MRARGAIGGAKNRKIKLMMAKQQQELKERAHQKEMQIQEQIDRELEESDDFSIENSSDMSHHLSEDHEEKKDEVFCHAESLQILFEHPMLTKNFTELQRERAQVQSYNAKVTFIEKKKKKTACQILSKCMVSCFLEEGKKKSLADKRMI